MKSSSYVAWVFVALGAALITITTAIHAQDCLEFVGELEEPAEWVAVSGSHAYFSNGGSLFVADVSDPANPEMVLEMPLGVDYIARVFATENFVYVVAYVWNISASLIVIDVSEPSSPISRGSCFLWVPGGSYSNLAVYGTYAYVAGRGYGLAIIDVSDPDSPILVGSHQGDFTAVAANDVYAYVTGLVGNTYGLHVVDTSDPAQPTTLSSVTFDVAMWDIEAVGGYAYVTFKSGLFFSPVGLTIADVSNPLDPHWMGEIRWDGCGQAAVGRQVAVSGNFAYVTCNGQKNGPNLWAADVSDPQKPLGVGHVQLSYRDVAVHGGFVYTDGFLSISRDCSSVVFSDSFESGDCSAWSLEVP